MLFSSTIHLSWDQQSSKICPGNVEQRQKEDSKSRSQTHISWFYILMLTCPILVHLQGLKAECFERPWAQSQAAPPMVQDKRTLSRARASSLLPKGLTLEAQSQLRFLNAYPVSSLHQIHLSVCHAGTVVWNQGASGSGPRSQTLSYEPDITWGGSQTLLTILSIDLGWEPELAYHMQVLHTRARPLC